MTLSRIKKEESIMKEEIRNLLQLGEEEALTTRTLCEHVRASVEAGNELDPSSCATRRGSRTSRSGSAPGTLCRRFESTPGVTASPTDSWTSSTSTATHPASALLPRCSSSTRSRTLGLRGTRQALRHHRKARRQLPRTQLRTDLIPHHVHPRPRKVEDRPRGSRP